MPDDCSAKLTVVREQPASRRWLFRVTFGPDPAYNLDITIDPLIISHSVRKSGFHRPGCHLRLGGLDDGSNAKECVVFRAFGEEDLRVVGKACLAAAAALRRAERLEKAERPYV
jgi:hypothetical protein